MSARRDERGFTLIELLLVMSLALVLLGATLTSFTNYYRSQKTNQTLNDTAQAARNSMDLAARQLRNLANQDPSQQTTTIARALPSTWSSRPPTRRASGSATAWTRSATGGQPSSASRGMLWESETATATAPTAAMMGSCPGSARLGLAPDRRRLRDQPHGRRATAPSSPTAAPSARPRPARRAARTTRASRTSARSCTSTPTRARAPEELRVVSSIFLRNQNEAPVADFSATAAGTRTVILNALGVDRPRGPHARLRLVPRQRRDHADAGGGLRPGDQAEGQRLAR